MEQGRIRFMVSNSGKHKYLLIFFLSFSVLSFELLLTRIFSVLMWYHFASLAIGIAMLGLGLGGVLAYIFDFKKLDKILFFYIFFYLVFHFLFFLLHRKSEILIPYLSFFHQPYFQPFQRNLFNVTSYEILVGLFVFYIIILIPFVISGFLITTIFKNNFIESQKLYYADMLGAGTASVFIALILYFLSPMGVFSVITLLGSILIFSVTKRKIISGVLCFLSMAFIFFSLYQKDEIMIARGKAIKSILWSKWNPFSRVIVYPLKDEEKINPFGQSRLFNGYIPEQWGVLVDDTGYTVASEFPNSEPKKEFFRWNIVSLPYVIKNGESLIIGPGGGKDISCAISMGVDLKKITAVELNPQVVEAVNEFLGDKTSKIFSLVNTFIDEGRSYLERDKNFYDVIQATSVYGRIPPTSGIFTFAEDNLYTFEAFNTYLKRLKDSGILSLSRFVYEKTIPKLILLSKEALKSNGFSKPENSIFLAKERGLATLLVKKGNFSLSEINKLMNFCKTRGFEVLYEPFGEYDNPYSDLIKGSKDINLEIPTDDKPFYYYNLSKNQFVYSIIYGNDSFEERGVYILRTFLIFSLFFAFLILFLPSFLRNQNIVGRKIKVFSGIVFSFLGLGYIIFEIVMIKSFSLFLQTPVYSMIFVVGGLLVFSALGALYSKKIVTNDLSLSNVFMVLILLIFLSGFALSYVNRFLYLPLLVKSIIAMVFLGVNGFFLGMPFPFILKKIGLKDRSLVAWGLATNSAFSVIGSFLTLLIVVNFGYKNAIFVCFFIYCLAFLFFNFLRNCYD